MVRQGVDLIQHALLTGENGAIVWNIRVRL